MSPELLAMLRCPIDGEPLEDEGGRLRCREGDRFPVIAGVPVLLDPDEPPLHWYATASAQLSGLRRQRDTAWVPASVTPYERALLAHGIDEDAEQAELPAGSVDPYVQQHIVETNGLLYRGQVGRLSRYPIPVLPVPRGPGRTFLDVGANWGRWSLAAAKGRYRVVAVDPWLPAALAGARVARQLGLDVSFVVADARNLPMADGCVDLAFSYSVLQHFPQLHARIALAEMARVAAGGFTMVQFANLLGVRQLQHRAGQVGRRDRSPFRVRHWTPWEILRVCEELCGPTEIEVDGFFSLNPQPADLDLLSPLGARVVRASERLVHVAERVPPVGWFADSLYARSRIH